MSYRPRSAFTLIELLVVLGVISLLLSITLPAMVGVQKKAYSLLNANNQRNIARSLDLYAFDNNSRFPDSIATLGRGQTWNWTEPMMLAGYNKRSPRTHRTMSEYLRYYIEDTKILDCPSAPRENPYLKQIWEQGNDWQDPQTGLNRAPYSGVYCFYWNYVAVIDSTNRFFVGPSGTTFRSGESKLLVSDYLGFDHNRNPDAYSSCQCFRKSSVVPSGFFSSSFWSAPGDRDLTSLGIKLKAAFTDGHVETYSPADCVSFKVIVERPWRVYPEGIGPGQVFIPQSGL